MHRSLHSVVPFQQIIAPLKRGSCLLTPINCIGDSNFLFVVCLKKKMRTDNLFSLHSFIAVTWFALNALLVASFHNVLLLPR